MTPRDRVRRYGQLITGSAVLILMLLCFLIVLSPRLKKLGDLNQRVKVASANLAQMRKEIEDARIIGGPATGRARFDKFGILSTGEEQLFLTDLISFCRETQNTLNLVRRSDYSQPAPSSAPVGDQSQGQQGAGQGSQTGKTTAPDPNAPPQPVILGVPHTVSFSGTFTSAFFLLRRLEVYRRLLTVERMDLATDTQAGYPQVTGNITINLFLVKELPSTAAPGPAQPSVASGTGAAGRTASSG